jgi:hypothetical protein
MVANRTHTRVKHKRPKATTKKTHHMHGHNRHHALAYEAMIDPFKHKYEARGHGGRV